MVAPVSSLRSRMVSAARGAAPEKKPLMKERSISRNSGSASRPTKMVGTPGRKSGLSRLRISMTPAGSGRGIMQCSQACQQKKFWTAVKPAAWKTGKVPTRDILAAVQVGEPGGELLHVDADVRMAEHHALAHPGGAAGVDDGGELLPLALLLHRVCWILLDQVLETQHLVRGLDLPVHLLAHQGEELLLGEGEVGVDLAADDLLHLGLGHDLLDARDEEGKGDGYLGVGVVELVLQLPLGVEGVVQHHHRADAEGGHVGDDHLGDVGSAGNSWS